MIFVKIKWKIKFLINIVESFCNIQPRYYRKYNQLEKEEDS